MEITKFSDYCFRCLIYLAINQNRLVSISEIADSYGISRHHLTKIVNRLSELGLVETLRGKGGGIRLATKPTRINIGHTLRQTENHFNLLECFDPETNSCSIDGCCNLKAALGKAINAFFKELEKYSLEDIARNRNALRKILSP